MKSNPIGILDSGVGGFSILKALQEELPQESIIAVADSGNAPYGNKSAAFITTRALELSRFLLEQKVKLIVVGCNTITVTALEVIRAACPETPVVGVVPVIKTAAAMTTNQRIGVLSTTTTAQSAYQKRLIEEFASNCVVFNFGSDQLVPLIEQGELRSEHLTLVLKTILHRFQKAAIDTLALGCTHFPLLKEQFSEILGKKVAILDSSGAVSRQVRRILAQKQLLTQQLLEYRIYTSGEPAIAKKIIAATIEPAIAQIITITSFPK